MSRTVMRTTRQPPPRPFENVPRDGRRVCPMCGEPSGKSHAWWHQLCADIWNLAAHPRFAFDELRKQADCCWQCRTRTAALEVEHIRPLWSLTPAERLELKWWLPFNLQLLCRDCHRAKTAAESRERFDLARAREFDQAAAADGLQELGLVPDRRRVIRRAS